MSVLSVVVIWEGAIKDNRARRRQARWLRPSTNQSARPTVHHFQFPVGPIHVPSNPRLVLRSCYHHTYDTLSSPSPFLSKYLHPACRPPAAPLLVVTDYDSLSSVVAIAASIALDPHHDPELHPANHTSISILHFPPFGSPSSNPLVVISIATRQIPSVPRRPAER